MRWEALFADLEAAVHAERAREISGRVAELTRAERAGVHLVDRLRACHDVELTVHCGAPVRGTVLQVADQWLLLGHGLGRVLVPMAAVRGVDGLPQRSAGPAGRVGSGLTLGHVLRALSMDRAVVTARCCGMVLRGRIDYVGADHLDLSGTGEDGVRGDGHRRTIPFAAIDSVHSR